MFFEFQKIVKILDLFFLTFEFMFNINWSF